jgi:hypothetical protein
MFNNSTGEIGVDFGDVQLGSNADATSLARD